MDKPYQFELLENENHSLVALRKMISKARELGATRGVGALYISKSDEVANFGEIRFAAVNGQIERPSNGALGDMGTNYFGVAMAKMAIMIATGLPSGTFLSYLKRGEVAYEGGLIGICSLYGTTYKIYSVFSGLTEEQDLQVARVGLDVLLLK